MSFLKAFLIVFVTLLVSQTSIAREPAVENLRGIPIDDLPTVSPSDSKGYSWSNQNTTNAPKGFSSNKNSRGIASQHLEENSSTPPFMAFALFFLLPFAIWFGFIRDLVGHSKENPKEAIIKHHNVVDINSLKSKKTTKDSSDDDDFKRAS